MRIPGSSLAEALVSCGLLLQGGRFGTQIASNGALSTGGGFLVPETKPEALPTM